MQRINNTTHSDHSLVEKIWKKSWIVLSALMNAISLINIGRDLKITILRWSDFLVQVFQNLSVFSNYLLRPFLGWFHIEIPNIIRSLFLFIFLVSLTFIRTLVFTGDYKKKTSFISTLLASYVFAVCITGLTWAVYELTGVYFIYVVMFIISIPLLFILFVPATDTDTRNKKWQKYAREQIKLIGICIFLICLTNYLISTYS